MKLAVLEHKNFDEKILNDLKSTFKVDLLNGGDLNLNKLLKYYDVLWLRLGYKFTDDSFEGNLKCKIIVCPATGIDHLNPELCKNKGIKIISLKNQDTFLNQIRSTAELTILLTLALLRKINEASTTSILTIFGRLLSSIPFLALIKYLFPFMSNFS